LAAVALVAAALAATPLRTHAATYKWVDEKGVVHYTDQVPPEAVNKANVELNKQGVAIKKNAPGSTAEQRQAQRDEAERQREAAKLEAEAARRDRALLDSYTTESDIDLAKSRSLKTVQAALQSAEAYIAQLARRRAELVASKAALGGKPVPPNLERELASTDAELERQNQFVARKREELVTIAAKYDADKAHWQAIKSGRTAIAAQPAPATANAPSAKK
jgi:hypothetical protein